MTDKEKIRAETERRIEELQPCNTRENLRAHGAIAGYYQILSFINSMQEEPVSEVLDEAAKEQARSYGYYPEDYEFKENVESFKEGAKWQEDKDKQTLNEEGVVVLPEEEFERMKKSLIKLAEREQQMMAKAIYAVVSQVHCANEIILRNPESVHWFYLPQEMNKLGINKGDKVKLIIIKED